MLFKKKIEGLKTIRFIIIWIKNIFRLSINGGMLMVRTKTKTFGFIWI